MAEAKGLAVPVKMKSELAALTGADSLPRTEITKKSGNTSKRTSYKLKL